MSDAAVLDLDELNALAEAMGMPSKTASKVLLVEDDPNTLGQLAKLLGKERISYLIAASPQRALDALRTDMDIGLMIIDLRISGDGKGLELIRQVRDSEYGQIPVIVVSADAGVGDAIEAMRLQVADFFLKPFDLSLLLQALRGELGV
ncbi:response regulator [Pseudomonas sp. sp1636]|uniref:response regulator n=1 Tax=Pseudomonas sp. sp1636 TaxID=3036707 RepID=UPI0025A5D2EA|nr:response regulator [Pseudomonas sp. sp1636]MDM8350318.1 response regulator [Pseudomonas sp. sp1636]